jgi:hypothetical protein
MDPRSWYTNTQVLRIVILVSALAGSAWADDAVRRLEVGIDSTVSVDVGYAIGFRCDDPKLISASMTTHDNRNFFVVKGVAEGKTQCRVGTNPQAPSVLFDVVVTEKKPDKPKPRPRR